MMCVRENCVVSCVQLDVNVALPSPDLLKRKIIVKNKKKSTQTGLTFVLSFMCFGTV